MGVLVSRMPHAVAVPKCTVRYPLRRPGPLQTPKSLPDVTRLAVVSPHPLTRPHGMANSKHPSIAGLAAHDQGCTFKSDAVLFVECLRQNGGDPPAERSGHYF